MHAEASLPDFRLFFELSPDVAIVLSLDLTIVAVTDAYLRATMRKKDIVGRDLFDVFPENSDDPQAYGSQDLRASFARVAATGQPDALPIVQYDVERTADGGGFEKRHWQLKTFPLFGESNQLQYFFHRIEDVTEDVIFERELEVRQSAAVKLQNLAEQSEVGRKRAEAELQDAKMRIESALEAGEIGTWTFDIINDRVYADKSLAKMFSVSEEDATGGRLERYTNAIHPEDRLRVQETISQAIATADGYEAEYRIVQSDALIRWVIARGRIIRNSEGHAARLPGVVIDISDRKKSEALMRETQERFELVTRATYDAIWDWNLTTNEVWWNEGVRAMFGYTAEQIENTSQWWYEHIHPEDRDRIVSGIHDVIDNGGENWSAEYRFLRADGGFNYVFDRGFAVHRDGKAIRMLGAMQDITGRKRAADALRESQQRLQIVLDSSQIGLWYCDLPFDVLNWSERTKAHFWLPPDAVVTFDLFFEVIHPEDRTPTRLAIEKSIADKTNYDIEYRTVNARTGEFMWIRAVGRAFYDEKGVPNRFDGMTIDVTADKNLQSEREQLLENERTARAEAETANRLKDEFLATLSHELRTPLASILGWSRLLKEKQVPAEQVMRAIEIIERNAKSQSQLIEDILDVSRIVSGKLRLDVRPVDLAAIIETAIESIRPAAEAKNIRLQRVIDSGGMISGDADRLQQVVWNLLSNAVKFTPKDGRVQVKLERVNSHVEIVVADNGIGMDAESSQYIFERFRQIDSSTTRTHGGLGLGLAIVRHLVELHGGTVQAASAGIGQGTTFTVMFPLIPMVSADVRQDEESERIHPTTTTLDVAFNCSPEIADLRILVVDDETDTRAMICYVLENCRAQVIGVASVNAALEAMTSGKFDILISDIGMPERDGYDLIKSVRQLAPEQNGRIPAVALTAYARLEDRMKVLSAGFQMHISKPVEPAELIAVVASLADWNKQE